MRDRTRKRSLYGRVYDAARGRHEGTLRHYRAEAYMRGLLDEYERAVWEAERDNEWYETERASALWAAA